MKGAFIVTRAAGVVDNNRRAKEKKRKGGEREKGCECEGVMKVAGMRQRNRVGKERKDIVRPEGSMPNTETDLLFKTRQ